MRPTLPHHRRTPPHGRIRVSDTQRLRVKEARRLVEPLTVELINELLSNLRRYHDLAIASLILLCGSPQPG